MRRILGIAAIAVAGTIGLGAGAGAQTTSPGVTPVLECIVPESNTGAFIAIFGYNSVEKQTIEIPIGTSNRFSPEPVDRGQPQKFEPGRQQNIFKVSSKGDALVWTLRNATVTANKDSKRCSEPPVPTGNDSPQAFVLIAAVAGVVVVGGGASGWWMGRRRRRTAA